MKYQKPTASAPERLRDYLHNHLLPYLRVPRTQKKPMARQLAEMFELVRSYHHPPHQYLTYELYRLDCETDFRAFVPPGFLRRFIEQINPVAAQPRVEDKRLFSKLMREVQLPHVPPIAFIHCDGSILEKGEAPVSYQTLVRNLREQGVDRVFAKPAHGANGIGHFICEVRAGGLGIAGGPALEAPELLNRFFGDELFDDYILQPLLRQHEVLEKLNPTAVNTVRIDTFVDEDRIHHSGALLRIGGGESIVDNWAAGGYIARIDLATGQLGATAQSKPKFGRRRIRVHPRTGVRLADIRLPFWDETRALVRRAAEVVGPLRYVGWDVALTPDGPVLIEGNHPSDISMLQAGAGGLGNTPFGRAVLRHALRARRHH